VPQIFQSFTGKNCSKDLEGFYKNLKTRLENPKILEESIQLFHNTIKMKNCFSSDLVIQIPIDFLKTLSYLKISLNEKDLIKLDPVSLLITCNPNDPTNAHTAALLKILGKEEQKENIKKSILETLKLKIAENLCSFILKNGEVKIIDLNENYQNILDLYNKKTLQSLADKTLDEQLKGLQRLKLKNDNLNLYIESLKPLHPLATWQCFQNEDLLKKQLNNEEKCQKMFTAANNESAQFQRELIEICLKRAVPVSFWKEAVSSWNLDGSIKKEIEKRAKKADKKPGNSDTQSAISYVPSQISYAPSSVPSSINTEDFAQRLSLFQEAKLESIPQVTLIEKATKFHTRIEAFCGFFDIEDEYNPIQYPGMSSFLKHAQKHTVNSDSDHELRNKKKGQLSSEQDQDLIKSLHLTESLEDKKVLTAFILPKNLNLKEEESFIRYVESVLNGAKMLSVMQKIHEDDTDQMGITWKATQPFEYFEFTKDPANKGDFLFQMKKGDYFIGALDQKGQNPRTIYPIEKLLEITPESELAAEMKQLSLSPKKPTEEKATNFKKVKRK